MKKRFDIYHPSGDIGRPELTGLVPNEHELDYGTPNLERDEDVLLVGSNSSSKEQLVVRFSWRPNADKRVVTLAAQLSFSIGADCFEYKHTETYAPQLSSVYPGRIIKFGSRSSKLRLLIASPYRRVRILFNGVLESPSTGRKVFLKLNSAVNPISNIFDFIDNYDEKCAKQIYEARQLSKSSLSFSQAIKRLLVQDRHEQKIRMNGEYLLVEQQTRTKKVFALWGFHARQFLHRDSPPAAVNTRRLYATMNNGQAFHIGENQLKSDDGDARFDFGYTCFETMPVCFPIDKPFVGLDLSQFNSETDKFEFSISGQGKTFECSGRRRANNWFDVETNGVPGWAWFEDESLLDRSVEEQASQRLIQVDQTQDKPLVVAISESSCSSDQLVGAKAASLNHLKQLNATLKDSYSVPDGFVLTKHSYELVQGDEQVKSAIDGLKQASISEDPLVDLKAECQKVSDLIKAHPLNGQILTAIENCEQFKSEGSVPYAVRSSSWGEDEDDMSAAGQLTTILNVSGREALASAIMACFASKFSYENIQYKRQHGLPLDMPMAVVVQEMVNCEKAGVMFTCDPTIGDDSQIIITANYGLGESVVSAQADPDSIVVRAGDGDNLGIEKIQIGKKDVVIGQNQNQDLDRSRCCLSDEEILRLARVGLELRNMFRCQMDIEFGFLNGELKLFQARPITGLDSSTDEEMLHECDRPSQAERAFFTRANIGEVMPYAIKPLTLTFTVFSWGIIGNRLYMYLGKSHEYSPHCTFEVYYENLHAYFNLRAGAFLGADTGGEKSLIKKAMEIGFFGHEMEKQDDIIEASRGFSQPPNLYEGLRFEMATFWLRLFPFTVVNRERPVMERMRKKVESLELAVGQNENKLLALYRQLTEAYRIVENAWRNHIFIITLASHSNIVLSAVLSKYIKDPKKLSSASNKFLAISKDVISAGIPRQFAKMASLVKDSGVSETFLKLPVDEALEFIRNPPEDAAPARHQLAREFKDFLSKYGHRSYNEFELAQRPWRERPEEIVESIKSNCVESEQQKASPQSANEGPAAESRPSTIDAVIDSLNIPVTAKDRLLLKYLIVPRSQKMLATRELTKDILVLHTDVTRLASRVLAKEMHRQWRIPDPDLLYYLYLDEIAPLCHDHQPAIVAQAIRRRNFFEKTFDQPWKYDEIIRDTTPNHLKPSKQLDEKLTNAPKLFGTPASSGRVQGRICLINGFKEIDKVRPGSILLTHSTDIGFSPIFPIIVGIITEVGGLISHGAVVAREYGLPSVIGIPDITMILRDGEEIILDADNGVIIRLEKSEEKLVNGSDQRTD